MIACPNSCSATEIDEHEHADEDPADLFGR